MANEDRLEHIKDALARNLQPGAANVGTSLSRDEVAWLIVEVERLRSELASRQPAEHAERRRRES